MLIPVHQFLSNINIYSRLKTKGIIMFNYFFEYYLTDKKKALDEENEEKEKDPVLFYVSS